MGANHTIRRAVLDDTFGVYELFKKHADTKTYGVVNHYDCVKLYEYVENIIVNQGDNAVVFVSELETSTTSFSGKLITGAIAAFVIDVPWNSERMCREYSWVVDPGYPSRGLQLLRELEKWAKSQGIETLTLGCTDERISRLLSLRGYARAELSYEKDLRTHG
jgi:N-acetylglutamate synthase-like GNAT family acetyltransferase